MGPLDSDARRYLSALWHHWPLVAGATLVGTIAGLLVARVVGPRYEAQGMVWTRVPERGSAASTANRALFGSTGWLDLLRSDSVLASVAKEMRLYLSTSPADSDALASLAVQDDFQPGRYRLVVDPAGSHVTLSDLDLRETWRSVAGDSVGADLGFVWVPPTTALKAGREIEFTLTSLHSAVQRLAQALTAQADETGSFIRVRLRGTNPKRIAQTLNDVLDHFVAVAADMKRQRLAELGKGLSALTTDARANLDHAQQAMRDFQARNANVSELQSIRDSLQRDRQAINLILAQASDSGPAVDGLSAIGAVRRSADLSAALRELASKQAQLRALRLRYTDQAPVVKRVLGDVSAIEQQTIPGLCQTLLAELGTEEAATTQRLSLALGNMPLPTLTAEGTRLERQAADAQQTLDSIQQRYRDISLAEASNLADVQILDRAAVPDSPVLNPGPFIVLVAILGSFGVSTLGAVLLDRFRLKVRYSAQVTQSLGLRVLGAVPRADPGAHASREGIAQVIEAMHVIRLNLYHAYGAAGPVLVTVTSPGRGDGKSFVASNLALAFAEVGERTLLIDGDVRRGELNHALGAAAEPGLTDALAADMPAERVLQVTDFPLLSFIGSGRRTRNAANYLGGSRLPVFLAGLRPAFDVILVDSPPLSAGVDAYALGTATGSMIVVFRTGVSDEGLATARLEAVERLPVRVLGAVLNDVQRGEWHRYYLRDVGSYALPKGPELRILKGPP